MKSNFDKLFVNCNRIKENKAKRILRYSKDLSLKNYDWDVPLDLMNIAKSDSNRFETFIGLGRWKSDNKKKQTKFICIAQRGELIYLEPRIIEIMYNSIKKNKITKEMKE